MAKTITAAALVSSSTKAAATTTRGTLDVSAADGGMIRWAITNGATAPTGQALARVMVARKQSSMPSAAAEGTGDDAWKIVYEQGAGTTNSAKTRGQYRFGPEVAYIMIEFPTHTGNDVTVECTGDTYSY